MVRVRTEGREKTVSIETGNPEWELLVAYKKAHVGSGVGLFLALVTK